MPQVEIGVNLGAAQRFGINREMSGGPRPP